MLMQNHRGIGLKAPWALALALAVGLGLWQSLPAAWAQGEVDVVGQAYTMADANGDRLLQLDEYVALSLQSVFASRHFEGRDARHPDPTQAMRQLLPEAHRQEARRLLALHSGPALWAQRRFREADSDHSGALRPEELRHLLAAQTVKQQTRALQQGPKQPASARP